MTRSLLVLVLLIPFVMVSPALGQSVLQVSVSANGSVATIPAGGGLAVTATGIGQPLLAIATVRYAGTSVATISNVSVAGTSEMTLQQAPALPVTLSPGSVTSFAVQYLPASGNVVSAQVSIVFSETGQPATSFSFTLTGTSPHLTFTYSINNGTATTLNSGDTIAFPPTNVGTSASAVISVSNSGSAAGFLNSVAVTGTGFQLSSSPAPATVQSGQQVSLSITFTPQLSGVSGGGLSLYLGTGSVAFALSGSGTAPSLSATYTLADGNVHALTTGTTITFPSIDINASATATITIANQGSGSGTVTNISVSGAGFQPTGLPALPATIPAGQSLKFGVVFSTAQPGTFTGSISIVMTGASVSGTLTASTAASNISLSYIDPATNNVISLPNNSTLQFPNTAAGSVANITMVAANSGTGTGFISAVSIGGTSPSAFQLFNLAAVPIAVGPSQQATFGVRFSPQQQQTYAATLIVTVNGQSITVNLAAQATGPQFTYTFSTSTAPTAVVSGGTITVPDTSVGQSNSVTITVSNAGTGVGQIAAVSLTGQGLSLAGLPALPVTLQAGASQQFTINFSPTQPGAVSGRLTIGSDSFTVASTGIGSLLVYSYTNSAATNTLSAGGTVIFTPIAVGNSETVGFTVQNTGTSSATISSINLAAPSTVFALQQLPGLPLNISPGATITFTVSFLPNNTGTLTAALAINNTSFILSGTGTQPASLPGYQFQGASGNLQPAQQPTIGLTLSAPYPLALQGSLTLTFASAVFTDDPSIEFANGSRTINFTIPANGTQAVFSGNATSVPLQTGTTAGTIVITPSFTIPGGFNLTPSSPDVLTLTIPRLVPQLLSGSVTSETLTGFTLILNGYSTTRALTEFDIQLTPKQGTTFSTSHLTVNVSSAASAWFQGTASQGFGGSFEVAIPFVLGNGSTTDDLVHLLQSLSITATNDVGQASAISVAIP